MSTFRSTEVSVCVVCGAWTNLFEQVLSERSPSGKWLSGGRDWTTCPNAESCWHHELEAKLQWLRFPHPATAVRALKREITKIRKDPRSIVQHDVDGVDAGTEPTRRIDVTFVRRPDAWAIRCTHHRDRDGQIIEATGVEVRTWPPTR